MWDKLKMNVFIEALGNIYQLLDKKQRGKGTLVFCLLFVNAGIDVIGLGAIYPLVDAALNPALIQQKSYLKFLYDSFGVEDTTAFILILSFAVLCILIIKNLVVLGITYIQTNYSHQVALGLNKKMFQYYFGQGFLIFKNENSSTFLHNVQIAPHSVAGPYFMQTLTVLTELSVVLFILISLLLYSPHVIILFLFIVLPFFLGFYFFTKSTITQIGTKIHRQSIKSTGLLLEIARAYVDIKLSNTENKWLNQFLFYQKSILRLTVKERVLSLIPRQFYDVILVTGVISILIAIWLLQDSDIFLTSTLSIFAISAYRLIPAIGKIFAAVLILKGIMPQIKALMVLKNYEVTEFKHIQRLSFNRTISLKNISFSYPETKEQLLLNRISFQIKKGETIGFIGVSGSGKTTLINLLMRLIREDSGYVELDGKQLKATADAAFQKNIGYVQQDIFIKDGTLKENIAFGVDLQAIDYALLKEVVKESMLADFIASHPKGLDMPLGENGVKLSGGQRQRVGIARALYKQAEILVFDEATSALDMGTESAIVATINTLAKTNKTIFIVAHRITTLSGCDRIYELADGQITRIVNYIELFEEKMILN